MKDIVSLLYFALSTFISVPFIFNNTTMIYIVKWRNKKMQIKILLIKGSLKLISLLMFSPFFVTDHFVKTWLIMSYALCLINTLSKQFCVLVSFSISYVSFSEVWIFCIYLLLYSSFCFWRGNVSWCRKIVCSKIT